MGRKKAFIPFQPHVPTEQTREIAASLAGFGLSQQLIAATLKINVDTLTKYYLADMEIGRAKTHAKVANAIVVNAVDNMNVAAQQLYAKTQMGWSETSKVEHSGALMVVAPWLNQRRIVDVETVDLHDKDTDEQQTLTQPDIQPDKLSDKPPGRPVIVRRDPKRVRASRANAKLGGAARAAQIKNAAAHPGASDRQAGGANFNMAAPTKNSKNEVV